MPDMNKKTILVVDDDHEIVRAITITLEREGYHVLNAYDGLQALDCVTSREVHLIIIDVMMPKLDGLSAVMKIREKKNLPIIILSAKSEDADKILGLNSFRKGRRQRQNSWPFHGRGRLHFEAVQPDGACGAGEIAVAALH